MAVTSKMYTNALVGFLKGDCKWLTSGGSTFRIVLVNNYSLVSNWNQDTQVFFSDISSYQIGADSGTYTWGTATGASAPALTTSDPQIITASNDIWMDAADLSWTGTTITATGAIVYYATGTAATSRLMCFIDFDGTKSSSNGTFSITWDATYGVFKVNAAT